MLLLINTILTSRNETKYSQPNSKYELRSVTKHVSDIGIPARTRKRKINLMNDKLCSNDLKSSKRRCLEKCKDEMVIRMNRNNTNMNNRGRTNVSSDVRGLRSGVKKDNMNSISIGLKAVQINKRNQLKFGKEVDQLDITGGRNDDTISVDNMSNINTVKKEIEINEIQKSTISNNLGICEDNERKKKKYTKNINDQNDILPETINDKCNTDKNKSFEFTLDVEQNDLTIEMCNVNSNSTISKVYGHLSEVQRAELKNTLNKKNDLTTKKQYVKSSVTISKVYGNLTEIRATELNNKTAKQNDLTTEKQYVKSSVTKTKVYGNLTEIRAAELNNKTAKQNDLTTKKQNVQSKVTISKVYCDSAKAQETEQINKTVKQNDLTTKKQNVKSNVTISKIYSNLPEVHQSEFNSKLNKKNDMKSENEKVEHIDDQNHRNNNIKETEDENPINCSTTHNDSVEDLKDKDSTKNQIKQNNSFTDELNINSNYDIGQVAEQITEMEIDQRCLYCFEEFNQINEIKNEQPTNDKTTVDNLFIEMRQQDKNEHVLEQYEGLEESMNDINKQYIVLTEIKESLVEPYDIINQCTHINSINCQNKLSDTEIKINDDIVEPANVTAHVEDFFYNNREIDCNKSDLFYDKIKLSDKQNCYKTVKNALELKKTKNQEHVAKGKVTKSKSNNETMVDNKSKNILNLVNCGKLNNYSIQLTKNKKNQILKERLNMIDKKTDVKMPSSTCKLNNELKKESSKGSVRISEKAKRLMLYARMKNIQNAKINDYLSLIPSEFLKRCYDAVLTSEMINTVESHVYRAILNFDIKEFISLFYTFENNLPVIKLEFFLLNMAINELFFIMQYIQKSRVIIQINYIDLLLSTLSLIRNYGNILKTIQKKEFNEKFINDLKIIFNREIRNEIFIFRKSICNILLDNSDNIYKYYSSLIYSFAQMKSNFHKIDNINRYGRAFSSAFLMEHKDIDIIYKRNGYEFDTNVNAYKRGSDYNKYFRVSFSIFKKGKPRVLLDEIEICSKKYESVFGGFFHQISNEKWVYEKMNTIAYGYFLLFQQDQVYLLSLNEYFKIVSEKLLFLEAERLSKK